MPTPVLVAFPNFFAPTLSKVKDTTVSLVCEFIDGFASTKLSPLKIIRLLTIPFSEPSSKFNISEPKIAILGINPHAGDYGVIGEEEENFLRPLVKAQYVKGIRIYGPFSADGFFGSQSYQKFDAVLAIYHDQGLTPFKTLSFGEGVNFTAGLDRVRTSPDHGTAYDIAGQGEADHNSFKKALYTACLLYTSPSPRD